MAGSITSTRNTACRRDCGQPDAKTCPKRRSGHTRWQYHVNLRKRDDGRWQQLHRGGFATRKDAEDALAAEIPDIRAGKARSLEDRAITVAAWAPVWLESRVNLKPASVAAYQQILDDYVIPSLGKIKLADLNAAMIDQFLADIRSGRLRPKENRRRRPDGSVSPRTVRHVFAVLQTMCRTAVKRRMVPYDPCAGVELEAVPEYEAEVWGPEEADAFLAHADEHEPRLALAFRLALRFGMRRGEILALLAADVGDDINVHRNAVAVGDRVEVGSPKSRRGTRLIPTAADPGWDAALRRHRKHQAAGRLAAAEWEETGLLITDEHGRMAIPWKLSERFRKLAAEAGLPPIRFHSARHSAATAWRRAGLDATTRSRWLGHSIAQTDRYADHVRPDEHAGAAARAAAYWAAASSGD